jgi:hypothetical protein
MSDTPRLQEPLQHKGGLGFRAVRYVGRRKILCRADTAQSAYEEIKDLDAATHRIEVWSTDERRWVLMPWPAKMP